ncbi:hypothetical protein, partial [Xanthomonas phaseoli]|uniref:hypothetical protein n=1 Tax=Xanthomonas phaseoli TaxID=1985254 RepID=UPI001EE67D3B
MASNASARDADAEQIRLTQGARRRRRIREQARPTDAMHISHTSTKQAPCTPGMYRVQPRTPTPRAGLPNLGNKRRYPDPPLHQHPR